MLQIRDQQVENHLLLTDHFPAKIAWPFLEDPSDICAWSVGGLKEI